MVVVSTTAEATKYIMYRLYLIAAYRQTSTLTKLDLAWPTILRTINFQSS